MRKTTLIMDRWRFKKGNTVNAEKADFDDSSWEEISLPHTYNAEDGTDGGNDYYRGVAYYRRKITIPEEAYGKNVYLQFDGVNIKTELYLNDEKIGEHKGGYAAFRFDITRYVKINGEYQLTVKVDNSSDRSIAPLSGDFTQFGGIYRNVSLILTDKVHIDMSDNCSNGVYLTTSNVSSTKADLNVAAKVFNDSDVEKEVKVKITLKHPDNFYMNEWETKYIKDKINFNINGMYGGGLVEEKDLTYTILPGDSVDISEDFSVNNPKLWEGRKCPYRYQVDIWVSVNGEIADSIVEMIGFRSFNIDKKKGFSLNKKSYPLRGVAMHQDYGVKGNAVSFEDITVSFSLVYEVGANTVRLSHYPHSLYTYELCDKYGIVVYSEIPFVNTYGGSGTYEKPDDILKEFINNTKMQLEEMIKQQYNRSCICFWGLYNEAQKANHEIMVPLVYELNEFAHSLDRTRLTVTATFSEHGELLKSDLLAWNTYPAAGGLKERAEGFYKAMSDEKVAPSERYKDFYIKKYDDAGYYEGLLSRPVALSEYGIGGSIYQHTDDYTILSGTLSVQTEEYQAYAHETWLTQIKEMDYLWGTYVWNMFDFSADNRNEATVPGVNTKGLVTRDRKTKKDSFYVYKAAWSNEVVIYVAGKNNTVRYSDPAYFKVYSNCESVTLYVDDKLIGTIDSCDSEYDNVFEWKMRDEFDFGEHTVKVVGKKGFNTFSEEMTFVKRKNTDTTVKSNELRINQLKKYICVTPYLTVENLHLYIKKHENAQIKVFKDDEKVNSGTINSGMKLKVIAEDGVTTAFYDFVDPNLDTLLVISVPSQEDANPADNLLDGNLFTRWSGAANYPAEIKIDLGACAHITKFNIKWFEPRAYRYTISVSENDKEYMTIIDRSTNDINGLVKDIVDPVNARYIKINVISSSDGSHWISIYEVMMDPWWFSTTFNIDEENKVITVESDDITVISKDEFIKTLNIEGDVSVEIESGDIVTVYYITDGDILKVKTDSYVYEYQIKIKR